MESQKEDLALDNVCRIVAPLGIVRLLGVSDNNELPVDVLPAADMLIYQSGRAALFCGNMMGLKPWPSRWPGAGSLGEMPLVVLTHGLPPGLNDMPPGATVELVQEM